MTHSTVLQKKGRPSRSLLLFVIVVAAAVYFYSQTLIQGIPLSPCGINDRLQDWTAGINGYLFIHPKMADPLLALYAAFGDIAVLILFSLMVYRSSLRFVLPLFVFILLRQLMEVAVSLPLPPHLILHDPGFPSLFFNYSINNDFYFSAYVGVNLLLALYLHELKIKWVSILGFALVFFEAFVDIVLRSHYTTDIYTSIVTAIFCYLFIGKIGESIDCRFQKRRAYRFWLVISSYLGAMFYILWEGLISQKTVPLCTITDQLHNLTQPLNDSLFHHVLWGDAVLIFMNTILDLLSLFVFSLTLWKRDIRPFLFFFLFMAVRQTIQMLVKLPMPLQTIWHYPGFPSLFQTYGVSTDLYFSAHTGTSLIAAYELMSLKKRWLTIIGFSLSIFEVFAVIIMQIHYTMDVFTAIMTFFCLIPLSAWLGGRINSRLSAAF